ncbi:alpha/beta hydrolase [Lactiplantibacillus herbarum]|uniref:alpha/beta hydrolase n=1 Tax=Lactiplantibacillus herbarum TaxID=1670446 RepID=UPI00064F842A|nr:alpha/beta hydrolase-fold protein [Lactiplantibacillus herbarum]
MALFNVSFMSMALHRTVPATVILPTDKVYFDGQTSRPSDKPFKTLYLLHGILGSEQDWVTGTRIQRWAEARDLAVVMPAGENSFYVDHDWSGELYSQLIGEELVDFTRKTFPLSHERADTYIGGLSMGGYGALYNGLKYHQTFGAIVALSAAIQIRDDMTHLPTNADWFARTRQFWQGIFGPDLSKVGASDFNLKVLVRRLLTEKVALPAIYQAIGEQDDLFAVNQEFDVFLTQMKVAHTYVTGPGAHEWDFWDRYLYQALDWLPLEAQIAGASSGNIKAK